MKIKLGITLTVVSLFLLLSYSNCSRARFSNTNGDKIENTSTIGNPMTATVSKLVTSLCKTITNCHGQVTNTQCQLSIYNTAGFSAPFGLDSSFDTLASISQAESSGQLANNPNSADSCTQQIEALSCSSPAMQEAYVAGSTAPFAKAYALVAAGNSCGQVYNAGVSLEVPVELVDKALGSSTTMTTFARTRTSFNTADYDGSVSYEFEVVATNIDAVERSVSLVDSSNSVVATVVVPPQLTQPTMLRSVATLTSGDNNYRIQVQGTNASQQLEVFAGRLNVRQSGATRTKIYVPLVGGYSGDSFKEDNSVAQIDAGNYLNYNQENNSHYFALWRKNSSAFQELAQNNPFTFEAVISAGSASGSRMYATLYNASTLSPVLNSEVSTSSSAPTLLSASFGDTAADFTDLDSFGVRLKRDVTGGNGYLYRAGLWIKLVNLRNAEVYFRNATTFWVMGAPNAQVREFSPVKLDTSLFSKPSSVYVEQTGFLQANNPPCSIQMLDIGPNDFGTAGIAVPGSMQSFTSTNKTLKRTGVLTITSGHRFIPEMQATMGTDACIVPQSSFVVKF